jgi:hypothetical protein
MAFVFYALFWVALDLWTTGIGLSMGFHELNPFGNQPFLEYPAALFSVTVCYFAALNAQKYGIKLLSISSQLIILIVASLPMVAVVFNGLAVMGYA